MITYRGLAVRGKAVLVRTGWGAHGRTEAYFEGRPFLTADAVWLRDQGAALVGIDFAWEPATAEQGVPT